MPISLPTGVHLRGSTFHLRIGIPDDIRHLWPKRRDGSPAVDAYRASLRTSNRNEAAIRAHQIIAEYRTKFETMRQSMAPKPLAEVSDALADFVAHEVRRHILTADENATFYSDAAGQRELARGAFQRFGNVSRDAMVNGDLEPAQRFAEGVTADLKITVDWQTPSARKALVKIARAVVKAWMEVEQRQQGQPIETPEPQVAPVEVKDGPTAAPPPSGKASTLRDVLPLWITHKKAKPNAIGRTERALGLFEEAVGSLPLAALNKGHGAAFVRFLRDTEARGFGAKTAKNHAAAINALMNVAEREDLIKRNPFDLTMDARAGSQQREAWTSEELTALFKHRLFDSNADLREFPRWRDVAAEDGRALLLLLVHTGARIGELAQLRGEDFTMRNGLTCVRITAEAGTVKTPASERVVPLAASLMSDPWFAAWVSGAMSANGHALPSMHGRKTTPGDIAGRWFRQFRADSGM